MRCLRWVGCVAMLGLLGSCGAKTDTSVVVTVQWSGADVFVLEFTGPAMSETIRLPSSLPTGPLTSPQTARILVASAEVGQTLSLTVNGLNRDSAAVVTGRATSPAIVANQETPMTVTLAVIEASTPDAGYCLSPVESQAGSGVYVVGCQASGPSSCSLCGESGDRCEKGACACGAGGQPCSAGTRCVHDDATGAASCKCDLLSGCQGCCSNQECIAYERQSSSQCGSGTECKVCSNGMTCGSSKPGVCGVTAASCGVNNCATENTCKATGGAKGIVCGAALGQCVACDIYRSNRCTAAGECACGTMTHQCGQSEICVSTSATLSECKGPN